MSNRLKPIMVLNSYVTIDGKEIGRDHIKN